MKKVFTTLFTVALLGTVGFSQTVAGDLRIGFQASPTVSWLTTSEADVNGNGTNFPGLKLGLIGERFFQDNYALTFGIGFAFNQGGELLFEQGGNYWPNSDRDGVDNFNEETRLKYNLQYVEVPLGLKLQTSQLGFLNFAIEPQAALGFRINARGDASSQRVERIEKIDISEEVNPLYAALGIGLTADYEVAANTLLNVGLIYQNVLNDITKDTDADPTKAKMHVLTLRLAVIL